jgi:hypothetical protein
MERLQKSASPHIPRKETSQAVRQCWESEKGSNNCRVLRPGLCVSLAVQQERTSRRNRVGQGVPSYSALCPHERNTFIVIDTPGGVQHLSVIAHGMADTLITPINDSLIDLLQMGNSFAGSEFVAESSARRRGAAPLPDAMSWACWTGLVIATASSLSVFACISDVQWRSVHRDDKGTISSKQG